MEDKAVAVEKKSLHDQIKHFTFGKITHVYAPRHMDGHNLSRKKNLSKRAKIRMKRNGR